MRGASLKSPPKSDLVQILVVVQTLNASLLIKMTTSSPPSVKEGINDNDSGGLGGRQRLCCERA